MGAKARKEVAENEKRYARRGRKKLEKTTNPPRRVLGELDPSDIRTKVYHELTRPEEAKASQVNSRKSIWDHAFLVGRSLHPHGSRTHNFCMAIFAWASFRLLPIGLERLRAIPKPRHRLRLPEPLIRV